MTGVEKLGCVDLFSLKQCVLFCIVFFKKIDFCTIREPTIVSIICMYLALSEVKGAYWSRGMVLPMTRQDGLARTCRVSVTECTCCNTL